MRFFQRLWFWCWRLVALLLLAFIVIQLWFFAWVLYYSRFPVGQSSFMRNELVRLQNEKPDTTLKYQWVDYSRMSDQLKRAVLAAEDDGFLDHDGVNWDAIERAYEHNQKLQAQAQAAQKKGKVIRLKPMHGGSTITQQLAKNLFLSGQRSYLRKGQELIITYMIEAVMPKERILEIYLNIVEWGQGVFGAQAAAQHYYKTDAAKLNAEASARLAVMLPAPKRYEKQRFSGYMNGRTQMILGRMSAVEIP